jgi:hypothetical protein
MNDASRTRKALAAKLRKLAKELDAKAVDEVFDELLNQVHELACVSCTLEDSSVCLRSSDRLLAKVKSPHAKGILRLMCARLSVRCSEWANRRVSPYGDSVELELPAKTLRCHISYENTPGLQRFEFQDRSTAVNTPPPAPRPSRSKAAV